MMSVYAPAGAPPGLDMAANLNPWTSQPDPNYYKASGGTFYTGPTGERVYVPNGGQVGQWTDPSSGQTSLVVLSPTAGGKLFPDRNSGDPATIAAADAYNNANRGKVQAAGPTVTTEVATGQKTFNAGTGGVNDAVNIGINPVNYGLNRYGIGSDAITGSDAFKSQTGYKFTQKGGVDTLLNTVARGGNVLNAAQDYASTGNTNNGQPSGGGGTGGGSMTPAQQNLSDFQKQLNAQAGANAPRPAPTVNRTGTTVGTPQVYTAPQAPAAQGYTAERSAPAQTYQAPQAGAAQGYNAAQAGWTGYTPSTAAYAPEVRAGQAVAGQVQATYIGSPQQIRAPIIASPDQIRAGTITAERIGPVSLSRPDQIASSNIDRIMLERQNADQSRVQFQDALAKVKVAAEGGAPSAAEALLRKSMDENVGTAMGIAASLQGRNPGVALRVGAANAKDAMAKSGADMAALRATEQATSRQQLLEFTKSLNANDIQQSGMQLAADKDIAISNAHNLLDAAKSNQSANVQTSISNLNAMVDVLKANQSAALRAGEMNAANDLQAKIENLHAVIQVSTSNAANNLTTQINNIQNQIEVAKSNQATALAAGQTNAVNETNASIANLNAQLEAAKANQAMIQQTNISNAGFMNDASKFAAEAYNKTQQFNAGEYNLASRFGAEQQNLRDQFNTGLSADALKFGAQETNIMNRFNTGESNTASRFTAGENNVNNRYNTGLIADASEFGAQQANDFTKFNATQTSASNTADMNAGLRQQEIDNLRAQGFTDSQIDVLRIQNQVEENSIARQDRRDAAQDAQQAALLGLGVKAFIAWQTGKGQLVNQPDGSKVVLGTNGAPILD